MRQSSIFTSLLLLLPTTLITAEKVLHNCQLTYSVDLITTHENQEVAECNATHWEAITNEIHAVTELEVIGNLMGTTGPDFVAAYQSLGEHAFMSMLELNTSLTEQELLMHSETADVLADMYYAGCLEGEATEECLDLELYQTQLGSGRRLEEVIQAAKELHRLEKEADREADKRLSQHQRRRLKQRGLVPLDTDSVEDQAIMLDRDVSNDDRDANEAWKPIGDHADHGRRLGLNCGTLDTCGADWCCRFCGHNCRRRLEQTDEEGTIRGSFGSSRRLPGNADPQGNAHGIAKRYVDGGPDKSSAQGLLEADTILRFERRVSRAIRKNLRHLARHGQAPCLGLFYKLDVVFERHYFELP